MNQATVTLKHKKKGSTMIVDQSDYATDLGKNKYRDYSLVADSHNEAGEKPIELKGTDEPTNEAGDNEDPTEVEVKVDPYAQVEELNSLPIDIDDDDVKSSKKTSRRKK